MRKIVLLILGAGVLFLGWNFYQVKVLKLEAKPVSLLQEDHEEEASAENGEKEEKEDGILLAQQYEFEKTKDIELGYVPKFKLVNAYNSLMTERRRQLRTNGRLTSTSSLTWQERGPNTDAIGPSNGNTRAGNAVTSGRMRAIHVDLADPTHRTVWVGGIDGGLWKTNDITAVPATWELINDFFGNLAVASICQDPVNPHILYFGTGEKAFNADAVRGGGVWKSTDHGLTWNVLPATTNFWNVSKVACDALGNLYVATIGSGAGIQRSSDGGNTWTNISPAGLSTRVTEMKISPTGRMHIVCGYYNTAANIAGYRFTDNPATVTAATWTAPTTSFSPVQYNCEITCSGNTLYVLNSNASYQTPQIFKSTDGGANWAPTGSSPPAASGTNHLSSGQAWYCIAIAADPANADIVIAGGLNCYRSTNGGATWSRISGWVGTTGNYVHADQHIITWDGNQVLVGSDGGIFYSANGGTTFSDRNAGLRLKQFYACAIHPDSTNYFLGGTQDNGCHQLNSPGLGGSIEVTGGDGAFVHIDQDQPQYQFGSYVFSNYRRSTNGGNTWSSIDLGNIGQFINPTDYDDINNILYTCGNAGQYIRWNNPQSGTSFTAVPVVAFGAGSVSHVTVSPYIAHRVFFGTNTTKVVRVDNANAAPVVTDITGSSMTVGATVSCVAMGTDDNNLLATFSNYGAAHVWVTTTGGGASGWTNISGNLPDIPVRWALYYPDENIRAILATDMGIYTTDSINGAATVWTQDPGFPVVRTDMLQLRTSDRTLLAATHGRGLWTSSIPFTEPFVRFAYPFAAKTESTSAAIDCRGYQDYTVNLTIDVPPSGIATITVMADAGSTAVQGVDFDFTTNGNFASPSHTITFNSDSSVSRPITLRIYDDASVETVESFTLRYTVSGKTNAKAAPGSTSYTFTINDNDHAPVVPEPVTNFTVGTYTVNLTGASAFRSNLPRHRVQSLFRAAELTAAGVTAGYISGLTLRVVTKNSTKPYMGYTISIGSTAATNLVTGFAGAELTQVYTGDYTSVAGDNTFTFGTGAGSATEFLWDGVSNIVVQFCFDNSPNGADSLVDVMEGSNPFGTGSIPDNYASTYANAAAGPGCALPAAFISNSRINAIFTLGRRGHAIETVLNAGSNARVGPDNDVFFYSAAGNIIARITSLNAFDFGCTSVTIDRAGNGATAFWNNSPATYLMNKTFFVDAASGNNAASWQVTLYFTAAEKAGWEAATGQLWDSIQLVKTAAHVSLVTPSNPNAAGDVQVVAPLHGRYGADYTLSYTFTGHIAGIGAGIPGHNPLPLTNLDFNGKLVANHVLLWWNTGPGQKAKSFEVQKSTDGNTFHKLSTIPARSWSHAYSFIDNQVETRNYYRIIITDAEGKNTVSKTVLIESAGHQKVYVLNNPFRDHIDLRFANMPQQKIRVELISFSGVKVFQKEYAPANPLRIQLSQVRLNPGIYVLKTIVDGNLFANVVLKF